MKRVVVVGAGVGGLSAAIHSRLRGNEVLVLEASDRSGGKAATAIESGFRLDLGPSIVILTRIYQDLFAAAGRRMEDYLRFTALNPIARVYFDDSPPLDLPAGRKACVDAVRAFAPNDAVELDRLLSDVERLIDPIDRSVFRRPYDRPWQLLDANLIAVAKTFGVRKTYKQLIDARFQSPLLRAFFYGFPSYGGQSYDSQSVGGLIIPYLMVCEGVEFPVGGVGAIPAAMEKLAREIGVRFEFGQRVIGFNRSDRRIHAVDVAGESHAADAVICNLDRLSTAPLLGRKVTAAPSYSYLTVSLGTSPRVDGLAHHTLLVPKDFDQGFEHLYRRKQIPTPPILYLNDTTATDPSAAPEGCSNLFVVITTPACEPTIDWPSEAGRAVPLVLERLRRCGIEIPESDLAVCRVQTPETFRDRDGSFMGSLYGPEESQRLFGLFPLSNRDPQYQNLAYCGGSVQPGAGLPMVTLSGKFAADIVG